MKEQPRRHLWGCSFFCFGWIFMFMGFLEPKSVIRPPGKYIFCSFSGFPSAFALPAPSCLPLCLDVARYAFDKGDCQSARRQDEITLDSNDRFGLNTNRSFGRRILCWGCGRLSRRGRVKMELTGVWGFALSYQELADVCFASDLQAVVR